MLGLWFETVSLLLRCNKFQLVDSESAGRCPVATRWNGCCTRTAAVLPAAATEYTSKRTAATARTGWSVCANGFAVAGGRCCEWTASAAMAAAVPTQPTTCEPCDAAAVQPGDVDSPFFRFNLYCLLVAKMRPMIYFTVAIAAVSSS